ncbi:MerR family transcriptional regulator [Paenibacillus albidus]|uniref:MerR family transcriptional regulator n=1 Tax=Paenibacillus albidus TaxID=2041023 RepID=A0A917BZZ5_9BACL|nr:MerR family transcriptional regulator [Paenibacillus albidus]GGF65368.1 MerR family transcriptional regulator [Paenibacillus albidus]
MVTITKGEDTMQEMQAIPEIATSIKQAAEVTGLSEDTIRYYERVGLLPYAERKANGHRHYTREHLQGILFLMRLKATGMTIEEMKHYRELSSQGSDTLELRYSILEEHQAAIGREIARLQETQKIIDYKLSHYKELIEHPDLSDPNCDPPVLPQSRP